MPRRRVALLTVLSCLALAAPAAASERSEARQYAAAMQPKLELTPEQAEAMVADYEARSAHIAATCLPSVKAAAKKDERSFLLLAIYYVYSSAAAFDQVSAWSKATDERLAAIDTASSTLRHARAARAALTRSLEASKAAAPADFCAMVTAWQANGWKGRPPGSKPLFDEFDEADKLLDGRSMKRGARLLRRSGATRAQIRAFKLEPRWPELRDPAHDVVLDALGFGAPERQSPDEGGRREPWAAASGADAG
jgi:hypothetical protein